MKKKVTFPLIVAFMAAIIIPNVSFAEAPLCSSCGGILNEKKLAWCESNCVNEEAAVTTDTTTTPRKKKRGGNRINSGPANQQLKLCAYDGMEKPANWCKEGCPGLHVVDKETGICKPICEGFVCPSWYTGELERILDERDKEKAKSLAFWESNLDILLLAASALSILLLLIILGILIARRKKKDKTPPRDPAKKPIEDDAATRDTTQLTPTK